MVKILSYIFLFSIKLSIGLMGCKFNKDGRSEAMQKIKYLYIHTQENWVSYSFSDKDICMYGYDFKAMPVSQKRNSLDLSGYH